MCRFININKENITKYLFELNQCYQKYYKYLQDDFTEKYEDVRQFVEQFGKYSWIVEEFISGKFMGFLALDNFIGNDKKLYSAEITTFYKKEAWGIFTKYSGKLFLKKCFDELGLEKVKAVIFSDNFRVKTLLKNSGFVYESTLKSETLRNNKKQDIEIYSIYRNYFYKKEEN